MHGAYARSPCGMTFLRTSHALSRRTCLRDFPCAGCKAGVSFRSRLMAERLRHKSDKICTPG